MSTVFVILSSFQSEDNNQNDTAPTSNDDEIEDLGSSYSDDHQSDEKSSSDCVSEEIWNEVLPEMLKTPYICIIKRTPILIVLGARFSKVPET